MPATCAPRLLRYLWDQAARCRAKDDTSIFDEVLGELPLAIPFRYSYYFYVSHTPCKRRVAVQAPRARSLLTCEGLQAATPPSIPRPSQRR